CPLPTSLTDDGLHPLLIDRERPFLAVGGGGVEFETADDAAEGLAQGAGAEAFLARRFPGDRDERVAGDLEVDAEACEVVARRAEDRSLRLDEDAREIGLR